MVSMEQVINMLLIDGTIDHNTEVHIEYARELNDANRRWAIGEWNKNREKKRKQYYEDIKTLYKEQTGKDIEPTEDDIKKFDVKSVFLSEQRNEDDNSLYKYQALDSKIDKSNNYLSRLNAQAHLDYAALGYSYRLDGNNVDIQTENVELASEQLRYSALTDSITQEFSRLSRAIGS